jgi:hypothetical protein
MFILFLIILAVAAIIFCIYDRLKIQILRKKDVISECDYYKRQEMREKLRNTKSYKIYEFLDDIKESIKGITIGAGIGAFILLVLMFLLWSPYIDEKIALYEEENIKIEKQIASVVNDYQEYELGIIKECAPDKAVTIISLYPELKSDTLVAKQIDTYIANNNKIKELKEEHINQKVVGWWFNFNLW